MWHSSISRWVSHRCLSIKSICLRFLFWKYALSIPEVFAYLSIHSIQAYFLYLRYAWDLQHWGNHKFLCASGVTYLVELPIGQIKMASFPCTLGFIPPRLLSAFISIMACVRQITSPWVLIPLHTDVECRGQFKMFNFFWKFQK